MPLDEPKQYRLSVEIQFVGEKYQVLDQIRRTFSGGPAISVDMAYLNVLTAADIIAKRRIEAGSDKEDPYYEQISGKRLNVAPHMIGLAFECATIPPWPHPVVEAWRQVRDVALHGLFTDPEAREKFEKALGRKITAPRKELGDFFGGSPMSEMRYREDIIDFSLLT